MSSWVAKCPTCGWGWQSQSRAEVEAYVEAHNLWYCEGLADFRQDGAAS